ncbi:MAG: hypothetical protein JST30_11185 [Armatimonadetes bacterium]|nr:hypothetical protein [Armatimonadota bacterium]
MERTRQRPATWCAIGVLVASALLFASGFGGLARPRETALAFGAVLAVLGTVVLRDVRKSAAECRTTVERLTAKAALLEAESQKNRAALDGLADGLDVWIFLVDAKGDVLYANERAHQVFGRNDLASRSILAATFSRELTEMVQSAAQGQDPPLLEIVFGSPYDKTGMARVWPESPERSHFFVSVTDVTDLRRLERVRRDFVANVSHELRTPMATIRAMAETILDEPEAPVEASRRYLEKVMSEIDRLTRISNDLLALSKAESKPPAQGRVDLSETANAAIQQISAKAKRKGIKTGSDIEPGIIVTGSEEQLTQVLLNLLENAVNYTTEGSVDVALHRVDGSAEFTVVDTGIGIPSEDLPRIFERFYRVDKARSRASGGTGLGLSIVRHIVESHGGKTGVESRLNEGSRFWFTLPLA